MAPARCRGAGHRGLHFDCGCDLGSYRAGSAVRVCFNICVCVCVWFNICAGVCVRYFCIQYSFDEATQRATECIPIGQETVCPYVIQVIEHAKKT